MSTTACATCATCRHLTRADWGDGRPLLICGACATGAPPRQVRRSDPACDQHAPIDGAALRSGSRP